MIEQQDNEASQYQGVASAFCSALRPSRMASKRSKMISMMQYAGDDTRLVRYRQHRKKANISDAPFISMQLLCRPHENLCELPITCSVSFPADFLQTFVQCQAGTHSWLKWAMQTRHSLMHLLQAELDFTKRVHSPAATCESPSQKKLCSSRHLPVEAPAIRLPCPAV